jgi:hypothetical protein
MKQVSLIAFRLSRVVLHVSRFAFRVSSGFLQTPNNYRHDGDLEHS